MQAGNQTSTPEYTLSMIEKSQSNATDFVTVFNLYLEGQEGGDHVDVIKGANDFAQAIADTLRSVKGITRLANDEDAADKLVGIAKSAGDVCYRFFLNLQSYKLELVDRSQRTNVAMRNNGEVRSALTKLSESVESIIPKGKSLTKGASGDIGDLVEQEMLGAAKAIEAATQRLQQLISRPHDRRASPPWTCKCTTRSSRRRWRSRTPSGGSSKPRRTRSRRSSRRARAQARHSNSTSATTAGRRASSPPRARSHSPRTCLSRRQTACSPALTRSSSSSSRRTRSQARPRSSSQPRASRPISCPRRRSARARCQGRHRGVQGAREARARHLGETGRGGGRRLQEHGGA
jgi:hypothetical protein